MNNESGTTGDEIAGVFGRAAATFDRIGYFSHFGERLVARAQLVAGSSVLDVATGRGALAFPAAKLVGSRGRVVGIDIAPEMLRETARNLQSGDCQNIELVQMNAEKIQYPDCTFDYVLCGFALWFFPHPHRALQEMYRVLKFGGRLALTTWEHDSPIHVLNRDTLRPHLLPSLDADAPGTKSSFDTKEQLEAALLQANFVGGEVEAEDFETIVENEGMFWEQLWSGGGNRRALERMSAPKLEEVKASYYLKLQALRQSNGIHAVYRALFALASK